MIITFDVGNTNTVTGVFDGDNLIFETRAETNPSRMADEYVFLLMSALQLNGVTAKSIDGAIISSVVPPVTEQLCSAVR